VSNGGVGGTAYTATNGALQSASSVQRWSHVINVVDDFGAKGDGVTDDWAAIQKAMGMAASGYCTYTQPTLVVVPWTPANIYRISQAIRRCPWVTLQVESNATTINFDGSAIGTDYTGAFNTSQFPTNGGALSGNIGAGSTLPTLAIAGPIVVGANSVTLSTPSQTSQLAVGDQVDIETTATYAASGATEPVSVKMALIKALPGSGVVSLDRSIDFSSSSVELRKISNLAATAAWPTTAQGLVFWGTHHSGVIGGRWVATSGTPWYQPFDAGGGCLDCVTAPDEVIASQGVGYQNLAQESSFTVRMEQLYQTAVELAYQSTGNTIKIGVIQETGLPATLPMPQWVIGVDEGSHDNTIQVGRIEDYNGDTSSWWAFGGTVTSGGGDVTSTTLYTPAILTAAVNAVGSGFTASATGTMTFSGAGCTTNPVLGVSTSSGGAIASVTKIIVPGVCPTPPSSSSTSWTAGGGITGGSGASFTTTGNPSTTISYTTVGGDTLSSVASAIAALFNANTTFATSGFSALANQANAGAGSILFSNSNAGVPFTTTGAGANSLSAYAPFHDVVKIFDAQHTKIEIGSVTGATITGYGAEITGGSATNEPLTADNSVSIAESSLSWQNGAATISGTGTYRNTIRDGWTHGGVFQPNTYWIQSNAGSNNGFINVQSDSPGGYPWCDKQDLTNSFYNVYTDLTPPRTTTTYNGVISTAGCRYEGSSSYNINKLLSFHGDFAMGNASSTQQQYSATTSSVLGGPEIGDSVSFVLHANLAGTAAVKTGQFSWWCLSMNWSIPAAAVGTVDVIGTFTHPFQNTTDGIVKVYSSAGVTVTYPGSSSPCAFGINNGGAITLNETTGSDILQPVSATIIPYAPTYSTSVARE
jgi:hypothetical protein